METTKSCRRLAFCIRWSRRLRLDRLLVWGLDRFGIGAVQADGRLAVELLVGELLTCKSPTRSGIILTALIDLCAFSKEMEGYVEASFADLPGKGTVEKLLLCLQVLGLCSAVDFRKAGRGRIRVVPGSLAEVKEVLSKSRLGLELLEPESEQALDHWLARNRGKFDRKTGGDMAIAFIDTLMEPVQAGDPQAKYLLALAYSDAYGVAQDLARSMELFREAAEAGQPNAQATLGVIYCIGHGVRVDMAEGKKWLRRAKEQGNLAAARALELVGDSQRDD